MRAIVAALVLLASASAWAQAGVVYGMTNAGARRPLNATPEGHLEVEVHGPLLGPFQSLHAEQWTPVLQYDCVYPTVITSNTIQTTNASGAVAVSGQRCSLSTGATIFGAASMQSVERGRYKAGQGIIGRMSAAFPDGGVASSVLVAGLGTAEASVGIGYNGTALGVLHSTGGQREIRTLTVGTGAGGSETVTITLNGVEQAGCAVTSGTAIATAYEISQCSFSGWQVEQRGATVVFIRGSAGAATGSYSLSSTGTAAGTFAQTTAGAATTDTWTARASWDDPLDGTGRSGLNIDFSKLNVFEIGVAYLGAGPITFRVFATYGGNDARWFEFHEMKFPGTLAAGTNLSQPSMPFLAAAYSQGSTTDVSVELGSFGVYIEGEARYTGPRNSFKGRVTSSTSAYVPLFTVRNDLVFDSRPNQTVFGVLGGTVAANGQSTALTTAYLIKNCTLAGTPSFALYANNSAGYVDTAATGCTFSDNSQIVWNGGIAEDGSAPINVDPGERITVQPGETLSLVVRSDAATADVTGALNVRWDQ